MDLKSLLESAGIPEALETVSPHWDESVASYPSDGIFFLQADYLTDSARFCGLTEEIRDVAQAVADRISGDPALSHLLWHFYRLTHEHLDYPHSDLGKWPLLDTALGCHGGVFYLLAALGGVGLARENDQKLGIPDRVTRDGLYDIAIGVDRFGRFFPGRTGVQPRLLYWFRNHTHYGLHRLGRLQYIVRPFRAPLTVYRHRRTGHVIALSDPGLKFDRDGYRSPPGDETGVIDVWESVEEEEEESVLGHPLMPTGVALERPVRLLKASWDSVLVPGDGILETHIPEGGGMTVEVCEASMRQALDFFPRHYPEKRFKALTCQSWIMNPECESFYSPSANFVRYQRELYLYPTPYAESGGVFFIFDADTVDPATAPRDTSIRRAMADHLAAGGILRNGGMFFFPDEMAAFGTQVYRSNPLFDWLRVGDSRKLAAVDICCD